MPRARQRPRPPALPRTSQIVLGERQSLQNALRLLRRTRMPVARRRLEESVLGQLIRLRTLELNRINPGWDAKVRLALSRRTPAATLRRLARALPRDDYYLARLLSDHPHSPADVLARLAQYPYHAVSENVARHPNTPVATLRALCRRREPLWYLVAFNPSAPATLRDQLRARIRRRGAPR